MSLTCNHRSPDCHVSNTYKIIIMSAIHNSFAVNGVLDIDIISRLILWFHITEAVTKFHCIWILDTLGTQQKPHVTLHLFRLRVTSNIVARTKTQACMCLTNVSKIFADLLSALLRDPRAFNYQRSQCHCWCVSSRTETSNCLYSSI